MLDHTPYINHNCNGFQDILFIVKAYFLYLKSLLTHVDGQTRKHTVFGQ